MGSKNVLVDYTHRGISVINLQQQDQTQTGQKHPLVSVIILNYNGIRWLERCLNSLKDQTIFDKIEVIVADNASPDHSDLLAAQVMERWPNGRVIQHGENLGFCEGNNRAATVSRGTWLLFLNNDTWLEPKCLELLLGAIQAQGAEAATPLVLNYSDDTFQSSGASGFDIFGIATSRIQHDATSDVFMPEGCSYLIRRDVFDAVGRFDREFFMFADETDLSWRLWIAGYRAIAVPSARLHHRGAANVNPEGGGEVLEFRTSETKRFFANRNGLMLLLKNTQHILLLMLPLQLLLLMAEAAVGLLLIRRWSFVQRAYLGAFQSCWSLRHHIRTQRLHVRRIRKRTDWWMLRFLRFRPNRWDELKRIHRSGLPNVSEG